MALLGTEVGKGESLPRRIDQNPASCAQQVTAVQCGGEVALEGPMEILSSAGGAREASRGICELAAEGRVAFQAEKSGEGSRQRLQLRRVPRCEGTAVGPQGMAGEDVPEQMGPGRGSGHTEELPWYLWALASLGEFDVGVWGASLAFHKGQHGDTLREAKPAGGQQAGCQEPALESWPFVGHSGLPAAHSWAPLLAQPEKLA